ncbi:putative RNA-directed DNA polymerase [Helianthus debilis subsp. tardiflorus]
MGTVKYIYRDFGWYYFECLTCSKQAIKDDTRLQNSDELRDGHLVYECTNFYCHESVAKLVARFKTPAVMYHLFYVIVSLLKILRSSCLMQTLCFLNQIWEDLRSKKVLVTGSQDNGLYFVRKNGNSVNMCHNSFLKSSMWHSRLGHPSDQVLAVLKGNLDIKTVNHGPCEISHKAKQVRVIFPLSEHKTKEIGDIVHLDLWGPYKVSSYEGFRFRVCVVLSSKE